MKPTASWLATVPLGVACLAVPLGNVLTRLTGPGPDISPFLPWLLLAGLGTAHAILFRRSGERLKKRFFFELSMFALLTAVVVLNRENLLWQLDRFVLIFPELTPVVVLGFCWLWTLTFGLLDRGAFQRWGAVLGALCILDLIFEGVTTLTAPPDRWIGDVNVLAGLLLVCLCASLRPGRLAGGEYEPDEGSRVLRSLILIGLLSTLSRTGLFAAGWVYLFFGRGPRLARIGYAVTCFLLVGATFLMPVTTADLARYLDYWLWTKSLSLFAQDPLLLLYGLPLGQALPISIPANMISLWETVTQTTSLMGIHPQQISSFWVRVLLGWGAVLPVACMAGVFVLLARRVTRMGAALVAVAFAQGMSSPLFFDPGLGAVLGLAFFLALSRPGARPNVRTRPAPAPDKGPGTDENKTPEPTPEAGGPDSNPDDDPASTWDMRPL